MGLHVEARSVILNIGTRTSVRGTFWGGTRVVEMFTWELARQVVGHGGEVAEVGCAVRACEHGKSDQKRLILDGDNLSMMCAMQCFKYRHRSREEKNPRGKSGGLDKANLIRLDKAD